MTLKFGTDGVRGVADEELTPALVMNLGRATARVLGARTFVVGRDTRRSGPHLQEAFSRGVVAEGADVVDIGVLPTPAVAGLCAARGTAGAVVSASHNPWTDNGVKVFAPGGSKLSDAVEERLEAELAALVRSPDAETGGGRVDVDNGAADWYVAQLLRSLEGRSLGGLHVVLDCANGASSPVAARVFTEAGARVEVIHAEPDGTNINRACGSTHPDDLQKAVVAAGADAGLAFDGDADRVVAVDGTGALVDGDRLIALCALDRRDRGVLPGNTVVVTVMTNLGFRLAMAEHGIDVVETQVGDRYVLEALEQGGWSLGGEQSGHVIFRDLATTGDGLLTGLQLLDVVARSDRSLADLAANAMQRFPQVLRNVRVASREGLDSATALWDEVAAVEQRLGSQGRVVLRPSGTEPVVRVMVEAPTQEQAEAETAHLAAVVEKTCR
ncbi:MAG TPA: phosphoglucosamine mutase [Acidimicrobiales bacterium]|nr:phosphoglucosamine mutase [Acidimicrobiales bacterium]